MKLTRANLTLLFLMIISLTVIKAQDKNLTYKQAFMFSEPRIVNFLPQINQWADDENYIVSKMPPTSLMKVNVSTGEESLFFDYKKWNEQLPEGFALERNITKTEDYSGFILEKDNDLYYFSANEEVFKRLTNSEARERNPKLSPDGKKVAFTRDNNLFAVDIDSGNEIQFTFDGTDIIKNGWASWVYYEEILGRVSRYAAFWWAPTSDKIAFLRFDDSPVPKFPLYNADGIHGELEFEHYPKAGDPNPYIKLGVADISSKNVTWAATDEKADHYIAFPSWLNDGKHLIFQWVNRGQDNIKLNLLTVETGEYKTIYDEKQKAWVDFFDDLYMLESADEFIFRTSTDGYYHLYRYSTDGKLLSKLTNGDWSVNDIAMVDEANKVVYFHAYKPSVEKHLFKVNMDGTELKQLTKFPGSHSAYISPGGKYFIDRYSNITTPTKIDLMNIDGDFVKNLGDAKTEKMNDYKLGKAELFTIPTEDGFELPAMWVLPADFNETKKYPVIFNIYGGPNSAMVRNNFPWSWTSYQYFAQKGIISISVDNRGSGHFGKKGLDMMHRNLGKWEMYDLIEAVKYLKKLPFVDTSKIGITGGSYGGYVTCMAMTYGADYFNYGIADFSVTDWQLYDNVYTERFMDTPEENPEGYKFGSAMTHADNYKGYMLITHGTLDDNVHMQNTIQLIDVLQNLDKDFEVMFYPNERHGFGSSKRNHYTRESVQFWLRHLLGQELVKD